ncbi:hypothetical protein JHK85_054252 [Glycine max]|uniref:Uncharacterized protein n=1 Tax=Glycine max TaxID=3847 RepID=K7MY43_SOYBN|nr:hypothetical protein JHK85_054252 [Glycine max]KAH1077588.1 hypothetical protein GYH30_052899 [Glycine max]
MALPYPYLTKSTSIFAPTTRHKKIIVFIYLKTHHHHPIYDIFKNSFNYILSSSQYNLNPKNFSYTSVLNLITGEEKTYKAPKMLSKCNNNIMKKKRRKREN